MTGSPRSHVSTASTPERGRLQPKLAKQAYSNHGVCLPMLRRGPVGRVSCLPRRAPPRSSRRAPEALRAIEGAPRGSWTSTRALGPRGGRGSRPGAPAVCYQSKPEAQTVEK
jgi:hypothetical protein